MEHVVVVRRNMYEIWEGDCLVEMSRIADKSVDMILCDLPYGTTACKWDTIIPFEPLWEQYKRIIKDNGAIVLTASQPFTSALVMSNPKWFKYEWIWRKNRGSNFAVTKYQPMKEHENILVFSNGITKYNPIMQERNGEGAKRSKRNYNERIRKDEIYSMELVSPSKTLSELRYPSSIQLFNIDSNNQFKKQRLHPTQKPVALFEYLIKTYTNEGDLVLDNCAGSGTTGVAAINTKRNFILIEKEPKYIEIIKKRLEQQTLL